MERVIHFYFGNQIEVIMFRYCIYVCSHLLRDNSVNKNNTGAVQRLERVTVPGVEQVSRCVKTGFSLKTKQMHQLFH